jgi:hypothetical protein
LYKSASGTVLGGTDNIFTNLCSDGVNKTANLGTGGSHHEAISAEFVLDARPEGCSNPTVVRDNSGNDASEASDGEQLNIFQQGPTQDSGSDTDDAELNIFQQNQGGDIQPLAQGPEGIEQQDEGDVEDSQLQGGGMPADSHMDGEEEEEEERAFAAALAFAKKQGDLTGKVPKGASCAVYGCGVDKIADALCECRPGCQDDYSCCVDYAAVCWQVLAPTSEDISKKHEEELAVR